MKIFKTAVRNAAYKDRFDETSRIFVAPIPIQHDQSYGIRELARMRFDLEQAAALKVLAANDRCETTAEEAFGLLDTELLDDEVRRRPWALPRRSPDVLLLSKAMACGDDGPVDLVVETCGFHRALSKKAYIADRRLELLAFLCETHPECVDSTRRQLQIVPPDLYQRVTRELLQYSFGVIVGRWDIRTVLNPQHTTEEELFCPLRRCSPGMLCQSSDDVPAAMSPVGYPFVIQSDAILVDSPDHSNDIVRRVRDVLELIWKDRAEAIEKEACEILGVKELRDYFRKPGNGGFWADHISRYSKSRRNAPIYWLLQSSKKNYALWLYYHRLDKDILFKAVVNYVEPKIRLEENRLAGMRGQKGQGESGKAAKKLDKDIEKQEEFISDLRDFEEKLRRAANLHLEPDLNDGVVLNIAPLWELVPWKEAKAYWEELMEGKYEWSSIGKQMREKGLVK